MADCTVTPFPRKATALHVVEQRSAGTYDPQPASIRDEDFANITAGTTTIYAVRIGGMVFAEFNSATFAARCATALNELIELGATPSGPCVRSLVRRMLQDSTPTDPQPPGAA